MQTSKLKAVMRLGKRLKMDMNWTLEMTAIEHYKSKDKVRFASCFRSWEQCTRWSRINRARVQGCYFRMWRHATYCPESKAYMGAAKRFSSASLESHAVLEETLTVKENEQHQFEQHQREPGWRQPCHGHHQEQQLSQKSDEVCSEHKLQSGWA